MKSLVSEHFIDKLTIYIFCMTCLITTFKQTMRFGQHSILQKGLIKFWMIKKIEITEINHRMRHSISHMHLQLFFVVLKLLPLERHQTTLWKSPQYELQFVFFLSYLFSGFFEFIYLLFLYTFLLSCFWRATEPFPRQCMHQQTCWYNLKGHVLFTLTEAFQNSDEGVPVKRSAVRLQQKSQQLRLKPNWLML